MHSIADSAWLSDVVALLAVALRCFFTDTPVVVRACFATRTVDGAAFELAPNVVTTLLLTAFFNVLAALKDDASLAVAAGTEMLTTATPSGLPS